MLEGFGDSEPLNLVRAIGSAFWQFGIGHSGMFNPDAVLSAVKSIFWSRDGVYKLGLLTIDCARALCLGEAPDWPRHFAA